MRINVYEVEVVISQVGGYRGGANQPEYSKKEKVFASSEEWAIRRVKHLLETEIKDIIRNETYCISHKCQLLLEGVLR